MKAPAGILLVVALALTAWGAYRVLRPHTAETAHSASVSPADATPEGGAKQPPFHCDGRKFCAQMTSCAEARYFLDHCPDVKLDGNHNGVPCEAQWCPGS